MADKFGYSPSVKIQIEDDVLAFDFDRCCMYLLEKHNSKKERQNLKLSGLATALAFNGKELEFNDE